MEQFKARINELEYENSSLKRDLKLFLQLNEELRTENKILKDKIVKLENKVTKLESELEKCKVKPNQPPGSIPDFEKENLQNRKNKPGQKVGHKGISRIKPTEIHKIQHYYAKCCQHCGSHNIDEKRKVRTKIITDLEFKVLNTQEFYHDVKCKNCGKETQPQSIHGNSKSPFGKVLQTLIPYLRNVGGMTIRPIENLFKDFFKLDITDSSISNNELRISKEILGEYNNYLELVKKAEFSHKDETSYRINGQNHWIWVFDSIENVFYRLDKTRSKKVIQEDFGLNTKQISINDCYAGYNIFEKQQICWAHLIREAKAHSLKENASSNEKRFYLNLRKIYNDAKDFVAKDPPLEKRQEERVKLENKLCELMLSLKNKTEFLERICNRLNNRLMHCFLFVEVKGLPSTNNQAERSLRPFVIHRKASFGSKSVSGAEAKVMFKTLFENAKRRKEQLVYTLENVFKIQKEVMLMSTT